MDLPIALSHPSLTTAIAPVFDQKGRLDLALAAPGPIADRDVAIVGDKVAVYHRERL